MMGSKDWGSHHQDQCPCYERPQLDRRAHWPHQSQCDNTHHNVTYPSCDLVGWLFPCLLTLVFHGLLLGLWCKGTLNLAKFKEFQVISVGVMKEWWLGANVLAMVEVRVKLPAGVMGLGMGGFLSPCMNEVYSGHDQDI